MRADHCRWGRVQWNHSMEGFCQQPADLTVLTSAVCAVLAVGLSLVPDWFCYVSIGRWAGFLGPRLHATLQQTLFVDVNDVVEALLPLNHRWTTGSFERGITASTTEAQFALGMSLLCKRNTLFRLRLNWTPFHSLAATAVVWLHGCCIMTANQVKSEDRHDDVVTDSIWGGRHVSHWWLTVKTVPTTCEEQAHWTRSSGLHWSNARADWTGQCWERWVAGRCRPCRI